MNMPPPLTPKQQQNTLKQILFTTELIQGGATINQLGNLVITSEQYLMLRGECAQYEIACQEPRLPPEALP